MMGNTVEPKWVIEVVRFSRTGKEVPDKMRSFIWRRQFDWSGQFSPVLKFFNSTDAQAYINKYLEYHFSPEYVFQANPVFTGD